MNVYDFDGTIYDGDSSVDLMLFCLRRRPTAVLAAAPRMLAGAVLYRAGAIGKTELKERFFGFLGGCPADRELLDAFWDSHMGRIKGFYLAQRRPDDVVATASPEFLVAPACERLGIRPPVGSRVDPGSGRFEGLNCRGAEKARRIQEAFPGEKIDDFYSDSPVDAPTAALAGRAWLVDGDRVEPWEAAGR